MFHLPGSPSFPKDNTGGIDWKHWVPTRWLSPLTLVVTLSLHRGSVELRYRWNFPSSLPGTGSGGFTWDSQGQTGSPSVWAELSFKEMSERSPRLGLGM